MLNNQKGIIHFFVLIILLLGIVAAVFLVTRSEPFKLFPRAVSSPISEPIEAETSFVLASEKTRLNVGESVEVKVLVRSDLFAANLFAVKLNFPADIVEVTRIDTSSFISQWAEQYYDNEQGIISLVGGIPNPGYLTTAGEPATYMASIIFKAKGTGSADIYFTEEAAIYSNDDNSNILGSADGIKMVVVSTDGSSTPSPSPTQTPSSSPTPSPTPIASTTPGSKGDGNRDGKIDLADLSVLLTYFNNIRGYKTEVDLNNDGKINTFDFSLMRNLLIQKGVIRG